MMFLTHIAFALEIIALMLGAGLVTWSLRTEGAGTTLAKVVGILAMIVIPLGILCTAYYSLKYWHEGYFDKPMSMPTQGKMPMMDNAPHMMQ